MQEGLVSKRLKHVENAAAQRESIPFSEVLDLFGEQGHLLITLFLCVPFLQPVPLFGLSSIFGPAIMFMGGALALGKKPWVPATLAARPIPTKFIQSICRLSEKGFSKIERVVRKRGALFHDSRFARKLSGILILVSAGLLALPIPVPMSNMVCAYPILFLSLGTMEEDGYLVLAGYFGLAVAILFHAALFILPLLGIQWAGVTDKWNLPFFGTQ